MPFTISPDNRQSVASPGARGRGVLGRRAPGSPWKETSWYVGRGVLGRRAPGGPWKETSRCAGQGILGRSAPWTPWMREPGLAVCGTGEKAFKFAAS